MMRYDTYSLPARAKVGFWNDVISDVFTPLEIRARKLDEFDAEISAFRLGKCGFGNPVSLPARVERTPAHIARSRIQKYFLHLQLQGRLAVSQDGRECVLDPGDMVMCDSAAPYCLEHSDKCSTLVLSIGAADLKKRLPAPGEMLGVRLPGDRGLMATTSLMMRSLWEQGRAGCIPEDAADSLCENLLDMFATSCVAAGVGLIADSAVAVGRRLHIRRYIETNLRNPEMSARSIAAAFGISPRYLHLMFAAEAETVSNYLLRRRLEETARQLADPAWSRRTITEVAFSWGFNNATHFARVFKERFGCSPREYRAEARPPLVA